ncbi:hypothetical protein [Mycobacterium sp.]|uniref:hypothetical protein n=1 Tax=Mycobacterium sp. TaxID=1785 RepID=UPI003F803A9D
MTTEQVDGPRAERQRLSPGLVGKWSTWMSARPDGRRHSVAADIPACRGGQA